MWKSMYDERPKQLYKQFFSIQLNSIYFENATKYLTFKLSMIY